VLTFQLADIDEMPYDILSNVASNIVWIVATSVVFVAAFAASGIVRSWKRFRFFGVTKSHTRQFIYLSTLFVVRSGAKDFSGTQRTFAGPAIPAYEVATLRMFDELWRSDRFDGFSKKTRDFVGKYWRLRRVRAIAVMSPADEQAVEAGGSIVCIGSQYYNSATSLFLRTGHPTLQIVDGLAIARTIEGRTEEICRIDPNGSIDYSIVECLRIPELDTTVFVVAGLGTVSTTGAIAFLTSNWKSLYREFRDQRFAICLRFDNAYTDPHSHMRGKIIFKTPCN
jgi:hypothetical protein